MLEFILETVLPLTGTFALGALGWFVAHYAAEPILRLAQLRREVRESLFFISNISGSTKVEHYVPATTELRRLAARLDALAHDSLRPIRWWWKVRGYDLALAVSGLTGLSNSLSGVHGEKAICRHDIEKGLRFPLELTDQQILAIQARLP